MQTTNNLGLKKPGAEDVVNIEDLNSNSDALDGKFGASSGHGHTGAAGDGPKIGSNGLAAGAATDTVIGSRTVSDTTAPTGDSGTPTTLLGWLANMIKAITGGATWRTLPGMTIAAIKTILDAATNAGTASTLMKRDASGRAQVAAPSAAADIARKDTVDAVQSNLNTHAAVGSAAHGATSAPTVSTLMARDSAGRAQVVAPSVSADIANKGYVDTAVSGATIPDASLTVKGKVQLSSAVNNTSEVLAATPKAVKDAYDRGSAGVTAAAAAQAKADGALPKTGGTISSNLQVLGRVEATSLSLTDFGTPAEIGKYIDFHRPGSMADYDGRLNIGDAGDGALYFNGSKILGQNDYNALLRRSRIRTYWNRITLVNDVTSSISGFSINPNYQGETNSGEFDGSKFTAQVKGVYLIEWEYAWSTSGAGYSWPAGTFLMNIRLNSVSALQKIIIVESSSAYNGNNRWVPYDVFVGTVVMQAGDNINFQRTYYTNGALLNSDIVNCRLTITLLRELP